MSSKCLFPGGGGERAACKGILFPTFSLAKGILFGNFGLGKGMLFGNIAQRKVKILAIPIKKREILVILVLRRRKFSNFCLETPTHGTFHVEFSLA